MHKWIILKCCISYRLKVTRWLELLAPFNHIRGSHRSRWDITVLEMSPPASWRIRTISPGAARFRPGWMITGHPSCVCACAVASSTFFSLSVIGQPVPISPITPQRISVPSAPCDTSFTITSVSFHGKRQRAAVILTWTRSYALNKWHEIHINVNII